MEVNFNIFCKMSRKCLVVFCFGILQRGWVVGLIRDVLVFSWWFGVVSCVQVHPPNRPFSL